MLLYYVYTFCKKKLKSTHFSFFSLKVDGIFLANEETKKKEKKKRKIDKIKFIYFFFPAGIGTKGNFKSKYLLVEWDIIFRENKSKTMFTKTKNLFQLFKFKTTYVPQMFYIFNYGLGIIFLKKKTIFELISITDD